MVKPYITTEMGTISVKTVADFFSCLLALPVLVSKSVRFGELTAIQKHWEDEEMGQI